MTTRVTLAALALALLPAAAPAQEPAPAPDTAVGPGAGYVAIELNAADADEGACRLTFLAENAHPAPIAQAVYEMVLFTAEGQVDRLTLFDFGALPAGRPRVRQFDVPDLSCDALGQVLVNGASTCEAPGLPEGACDAGLRLESRTAIGMLG